MSAQNVDPTEHWASILGEAQRLIDARETVRARNELEELISFVGREWGPDDVHLIRPLYLLAASHYREHEPLDPNNRLEVECLERALAIARLRLGPDDPEVAALAGKVGSSLVIAGALDDGCALMSECIDIATRIGELDNFSRYFGLIGHTRMAQARPQDALWFFEQNVAACERYHRSPTVIAGARFNLGRCLRQLDRHEDARRELESALALVNASRKDSGLIGAVQQELALVRRT